MSITSLGHISLSYVFKWQPLTASLGRFAIFTGTGDQLHSAKLDQTSTKESLMKTVDSYTNGHLTFSMVILI